MESLEKALKATQLVFEENSAGDHPEATMNAFGKEKPRSALNCVLNVLKANFRSGDLLDPVCDLKDATNEVLLCQRNNQRAFRFVWYRNMASQQWNLPYPVGFISNVECRISRALYSVLEAFRVHPFAVSPEKTRHLYDLPTFAILTHNREAADRHEELARQIGKACVDDHARRHGLQVRELDVLQTSLFKLLWSGTVEQLKHHSPHASDDPEQPKFERAVEELERVLEEGIVRSKVQHFSIAFCGMVKAGKSMFLNALMGQSILPSDGESVDSHIPYPILSITAELPSTAWPCRIRHIEGQTVPKLQFQAEPFLSALKKLQTHQYRRKMQTYPSPVGVYYAPSDSSDEEILLRTIHRQWGDLHAVTRDNLLKFETPGFELPQMATGEQNVKILVSSVSLWTVLFSTERCTQLGQLNDIVRLCQRFDLKFEMSEVDWPLLTIEFNLFRGRKMDGIYEVGRNALMVFLSR